MSLAKTYEPKDIEDKHYANWEASGVFAPAQNDAVGSYTIVIPPPNVTGSLHMGHALNNTLQDILIRFQRMRGLNTLWQPGTDHAGIATQMVVERQLDLQGIQRRDLGRRQFVERVWQWKDESGGTIVGQLKRLGASADWSRERFTMDPEMSHAVIRVFVDLYNSGLVYKDKRLVNWDPKLLTAISDLEVENREVEGKLWHIKYSIEGIPSQFITIATTRPETMLGDTAIAVHPDDARYTNLIGKNAILPLVGRSLPIVADHYADPQQGSGAVKITPGHDFNDFELGKRHGLEVINIFDQHACISDDVPVKYRGLDRFKARSKVLDDLALEDRVEKIEIIRHTVPYGDRSGAIVEPWLTQQWYVDAEKLAKPAIEAVERGQVVFVPRQWEKTFFDWMNNIQPWCVSRQLWWGHQIPAWYGPDGHVFVAENESAAQDLAKSHYGNGTELTRDADVLDTWFSSALWPFSTLGWPAQTKELSRHYPTDTLVTGFDIIFFWVARMLMMGMHFMGQAPFKKVYVHALVRDESGQKMSKSKGNIIDPLELIDTYGADALRFTLAAMAAQGRDIKLSTSRVEGYRNFATKLWNAARFCELNKCLLRSDFVAEECRGVVNRWIVGETVSVIQQTTEAIQNYRFNEAADSVYHFTWHTFCDWYLEFIKDPLKNGDDDQARKESQACAAWVLSKLLLLLHPFMPFITEELWSHLSSYSKVDNGCGLIVSEWPESHNIIVDSEAKEEIGWMIRFISGIRSVRVEMNFPPKTEIDVLLVGANTQTCERIVRNAVMIRRLAGLSSLQLAAAEGKEDAVQLVIDEATAFLSLSDEIDVLAECERLQKEIRKIDKELEKISGKLKNNDFLNKAPAAVVEEQRLRQSDYEEKRHKLKIALARLKT